MQTIESQTPASETGELSPDAERFRAQIVGHLIRTLGQNPDTATSHDVWEATCLAARSYLLQHSCQTRRHHRENNVKRLYYLSLEYLMGRLLENNLVNSGLIEPAREALAAMGHDFDRIFSEGTDMGLGNGGLGRLAACFLDSLATLDLPAVGYGINYEFGLFRQEFEGGRQIEQPDVWRRFGNPWQTCRQQYSVTVKLFGHVEWVYDDLGQGRPVWTDAQTVVGVPWDIAIAGYHSNTVNALRLWESRSSQDLDLEKFNEGGYIEAVRDKAISETISKVLYPNDATEAGRELRLVQQYFFVACSMSDIVRRHRKNNDTWDSFPEKCAIQLNDTH
ncbi:MAG: glycogen/starch/alpha-glucan phosphorylase, partial [Verrucomicrobiae bacterium]|nr:glycogen/starch/alpha-glucan phosphorylase [Verrucomicrobiae bacterium]